MLPAVPRVVCRDYEAKSVLDSYESAGIDNDEVAEGGYEEQLAARMRAEEAMEAADGRRGRGRKRALPGALEGKQGPQDGASHHPAALCAQAVKLQQQQQAGWFQQAQWQNNGRTMAAAVKYQGPCVVFCLPAAPPCKQ